jgi:general secretion pathway protein C
MPRAITIVNILLGIAIIAVVAAMVSDRLILQLDRTLVPKGARERGPGGEVVVRTEGLASYAPILTNGLFGRATQGALTPIAATPATPQAAPATAPTELVLLGTATGSFRETFALVRHLGKQEERVFRLGEMVFDAGRLVQVTRERAFIVVNGKKVELLTPMTPQASKPGDQAAPRLPGGGVIAGAGGGIIDQRALNAALDNIGQAMSDARLLPSQKEGKVEGFRVSEVKPSGVFAMVGIRNNDILLRLNDFTVDSPDKALQSFIALKGQNKLKLDLVRNGQPVTLNYDIR